MADVTLTGDILADAELLVAAGAPERAATLLAAHLEQGRGGLLTRIALGRAQLAARRTENALATLREAVALAPGIADAAIALADALLATGHLPTAIAELQRALRLDPDNEAARFKLACAWLEGGEAQRALAMLAELEGSPAYATAAAEKTAEAEALLRADRSPAGYVRHLFDQFSADYDARMLGTLGYQAPLILRSLFDLLRPATNGLSILDLGCGTGLAGEAFREVAQGGRLAGIDLSPRMIERARERAIYDALLVADLEAALQTCEQAYDLVLAADTLVYLGDLKAVFAGVATCLMPSGIFLFTVERASGTGFDLGPKRRYRHSEAYLREEAAKAGFDVMGVLECAPRHEAAEPVPGLAVALEK